MQSSKQPWMNVPDTYPIEGLGGVREIPGKSAWPAANPRPAAIQCPWTVTWPAAAPRRAAGQSGVCSTPGKCFAPVDRAVRLPPALPPSAQGVARTAARPPSRPPTAPVAAFAAGKSFFSGGYASAGAVGAVPFGTPPMHLPISGRCFLDKPLPAAETAPVDVGAPTAGGSAGRCGCNTGQLRAACRHALEPQRAPYRLPMHLQAAAQQLGRSPRPRAPPPCSRPPSRPTRRPSHEAFRLPACLPQLATWHDAHAT